jgi:hypothetical protein
MKILWMPDQARHDIADYTPPFVRRVGEDLYGLFISLITPHELGVRGAQETVQKQWVITSRTS